jgi:branched-chain amino acid transport system ATP-binding protein
MSEPILSVSGLGVGYGQTTIVSGLDLSVERGEVLTMLGLNGAGKTTVLKAIAGLLPHTGRVVFDGHDVSRWPGNRINRAGLAYVPQGMGVYPGISVGEHLRLSRHFQDERIDMQNEVLDWFPILKERMKQDAQSLSGGQRKMLSFVMALSSAPSLVLLDEPTEGVAPVVREQLVEALAQVVKRTSVLLVEQNLDTALAIGGRCHVIEQGAIVESGMIRDLHASGVIEARLSV